MVHREFKIMISASFHISVWIIGLSECERRRKAIKTWKIAPSYRNSDVFALRSQNKSEKALMMALEIWWNFTGNICAIEIERGVVKSLKVTSEGKCVQSAVVLNDGWIRRWWNYSQFVIYELNFLFLSCLTFRSLFYWLSSSTAHSQSSHRHSQRAFITHIPGNATWGFQKRVICNNGIENLFQCRHFVEDFNLFVAADSPEVMTNLHSHCHNCASIKYQCLLMLLLQELSTLPFVHKTNAF